MNLSSGVSASSASMRSAPAAVPANPTILGFTAIVVAFLLSMGVRTHRSQVRTGTEGLIHERGVARTEIAPRGKVFVHGEIWDAVAENPIPAGTPINVVAVEGMVLRVRPEKEE